MDGGREASLEEYCLGCHGVRDEGIIGYLCAAASQETLDEVDGFRVKAEAGESLDEDVMVDKVKKPEMSNIRAVAFRPLSQVLWMS